MPPHGAGCCSHAAQSAIGKKLQDSVMGGVIASTVALGVNLGLFDALAAVGSEEKPASAKDVADKADCKERYVTEWLATMACGGMVQITPEDKFWLTSDQAATLTSASKDKNLAKCMFFPMMVKPLDKLEDAFKKGGRLGLEYSDFAGFYELNKKLAPHGHGGALIPQYIPLTGMTERLEAGGLRVLDIGCAGGFQLLQLAKKYPANSFTGIDIGEEAIGLANATKASEGVTNAEFFVMDATRLSEEWNHRFDLITIFAVAHDLTRPDLALAGVHRLLKKGGILSMLEPSGSMTIYEDAQATQNMATNYGFSLMHGVAVASNSPDALGIGPRNFERHAMGLLEGAGFSSDNVQKQRPSFSHGTTLYICTKA